MPWKSCQTVKKNPPNGYQPSRLRIEKRPFGFWNFQHFCTGFSPYSCIYLPLVFDVGDLRMDVLSVDVFPFCLLFLTVRPPLLQVYSRPCLPVYQPAEATEQQRRLPVHSSGSFIPEELWELSSMVSVGPCWEVSPCQETQGSGLPSGGSLILSRAQRHLELERCAGRTAAQSWQVGMFKSADGPTAAPSPQGALSLENGSFIYKPPTGVCCHSHSWQMGSG